VGPFTGGHARGKRASPDSGRSRIGPFNIEGEKGELNRKGAISVARRLRGVEEVSTN